jgi:hypothetical protein
MRKRATIGMVSFLLIAITAGGIHAAKLSEDTLKKKKEGWYPTGLPLINFSSDEGIGYGLRAYLYYNGSREDEYFDTAIFFRCMPSFLPPPWGDPTMSSMWTCPIF